MTAVAATAVAERVEVGTVVVMAVVMAVAQLKPSFSVATMVCI